MHDRPIDYFLDLHAIAPYGLNFSRTAELLQVKGWKVNRKLVESVWCEEGLRLPRRRKKRKWLYQKECSVIQLSLTQPNIVWAVNLCVTNSIMGVAARCGLYWNNKLAKFEL